MKVARRLPHMDASKRVAARRRWIYTVLFVLGASASMVGPTQALSGLVSRSLSAIYTVVDSGDSAEESSVDHAVAEPNAAAGGGFPFAASRDDGAILVDFRETSSDEWARQSVAPLVPTTQDQSQRHTSSSASGASSSASGTSSSASGVGSSTVNGGQSFSSSGAMPGRIPVPLAFSRDASSGMMTLDELQGMDLIQEFGPEAVLLDASAPPRHPISAYDDDAMSASDRSWALPPWSPTASDPLIAPPPYSTSSSAPSVTPTLNHVIANALSPPSLSLSPYSASSGATGVTPTLNHVIADTLSPPFTEGTGGGPPDDSDALPLTSSVLATLHRNDSSAEESEGYAREEDETEPAAVPEPTPFLLLATGAAACFHRARWRKRQLLSRASRLDRLHD